MHKLEVIVTSGPEAAVAVEGGADRLELVRDLNTGGLTPAYDTVLEVNRLVSIPVRVMLRENSSMTVASSAELKVLQTKAAAMHDLRIDGFVMGWVTPSQALDISSLEAVLAVMPTRKVTFHRAFEYLADPFAGIAALKRFPQIDRILTGGGPGTWTERKARLLAWTDAAAPEIIILVGGGLSEEQAAELLADPQFPEVHIGRAARTPSENNGRVDAGKISYLKMPR